MSEKERVQKMINDSASKYSPDPQPDRGPAQSGPTGTPLSVPKHMTAAPGHPGVQDTVPAERARQAQQDRNLHGAPPAPRKP